MTTALTMPQWEPGDPLRLPTGSVPRPIFELLPAVKPVLIAVEADAVCAACDVAWSGVYARCWLCGGVGVDPNDWLSEFYRRAWEDWNE